jgi:hypothetical protein
MLQSKRYLTVLLALAVTLFTLSNAITEDENVVGLRDANSSRERPRLDGYDMDESV